MIGTMGIELATAIPGWMTADELRWLAEQASTRHIIVEVGSDLGRSTTALATHTPGVVYAVDTWDGGESRTLTWGLAPGRHYPEFRRNCRALLDARKLVAVVATSLEAAARFAADGFRADMVFLDGLHDRAAIRADILSWRSLLKPGGLLCGHDFRTLRTFDPKLATQFGPECELAGVVRELLPDFRLADGDSSIWWAHV